MPKAPSEKKVKPLRKIKNKYPDLSLKNKALYKAVSHLPVSVNSKLPVAYAKSLPMIIGVVTIFILMILPSTRENILKFSKKYSENFIVKTEELADYFSLSMRAGVSAYVEQMDKYINPLPVDADVEVKLYGGRIETEKISKLDINLAQIAESAHLMTARVSAVFDNIDK